VYFLSRFEGILSKYVGIALPEFPAMETMQNKASFMRMCEQLDLPIPNTTYFRSRQELEQAGPFPYYIKLAHSTAGCGVHYVRDAAELKLIADRLEQSGAINGQTESLVQQPAKGVQSTVQAVFQHGRMVGAHMFEARRLGVGGMSPARVSATHEVVYEQVAQMGEHLNWHGATFIDYFYDESTKRPEYIEANPRIGETVNAQLCGENLPEKLVQVSLDQPLETFQPPKSDPGLRSESFYMIMISDAHDGKGRLYLLRELIRKVFRRGMYHNSTDELTRPGDDLWSVLPAIWICIQLLVLPSRSKAIVQQTIDNYSLPESAVEKLRQLPVEHLQQALDQAGVPLRSESSA